MGGAVSAGDLDGDGYGDFAVASTCILLPKDCPQGSGQIRIFKGGPSGAAPPNAPTWLLDAPDGPTSRFGYSLATAGDFNGDGYADLAVTAISSVSSSRAYVFFGSPTGPGAVPLNIDVPPGTGVFGEVAGGCDLNGDAFPDLVVGTGYYPGNYGLTIFTGGSTSGTSAIALTMPSEIPSLGQTRSVLAHTVGDLNGDGLCDVFSASSGTDAGTAFVYFGSASSLTLKTLDQQFAGAVVNQSYGVRSAIVGDLNGDGFDDAVVAAPGVSFVDQGTMYFYAGGAGGLDAGSPGTIAPLNRGSAFGLAEGAGDVDGDGFQDMVCAAYYTNQLNIIPGSATGPGVSVPLVSPDVSWWYVGSLQ
jgi:hypothetical protein